MMSDDDFRQYLDALARKHLRLRRLHRHPMIEFGKLEHDLERLLKARQLTGIVADDPNNEKLVSALVDKLRNTYLSHFIDAMEQTGVLDAVEEDPRTLFSNMRISAVPHEDTELLRQAGHPDPEAEITLLVHYARTHLSEGRRNERSPTDALGEATEVMSAAATRLENSLSMEPSKSPVADRKKRKIFNGIGKVLSGGVLGTGNILLGVGSIAAPNPAVAYGVIGSCAVAIASVCQGIGDLRGE